MTEGWLRSSIRRRIDYLRTSDTEFATESKTGNNRRESEQLATEWKKIARYVYRRVINVPSPLVQRPRLLPKSVPIDHCVFFDTETTGLAGGAGTVIFLFGIGAIRNDRMAVEQVFLADFPGESAFLEYIESLLADYHMFISFNGKSFDKRILDTRFLMDGRNVSRHDHLDLLYPARRLWASVIPDCRLKTLEKEILGIDRGKDIDGFEVPDIYFEFIRTGKLGQLPYVFEHNYSDVITLARLLAMIEQVLAGDATVTVDLHGVGRLLLAHDDRRGLDCLRKGYDGGNLACGTTLGNELKRTGAWNEAIDLWRDMAKRYRNQDAAVELSKYYEHRIKDYVLALRCLKPFFEDALTTTPSIDHDLLNRIARLRRKHAEGAVKRNNIK